MSGSSPDTRAVRGALITLMWGLGRVALCSEEGCDAGAGSERHYRGNGGEQQHLGASIIYKTPAATKAKRDQNQENSIA